MQGRLERKPQLQAQQIWSGLYTPSIGAEFEAEQTPAYKCEGQFRNNEGREEVRRQEKLRGATWSNEKNCLWGRFWIPEEKKIKRKQFT